MRRKAREKDKNRERGGEKNKLEGEELGAEN